MAINNPYIPGDPYSYDLKWIVTKVKEILLQLGTLDEAIEKKIFEGFVEHSIVQFHNVADMLAADIKDGSIVLTLGYYEAGDLGTMFYLIKDFNPGQCSLDYFLTMDNNAQIAIPIVVTPYVTPEMFGAYGDGSSDDSLSMQRAAKYGNIVLTKSYKITEGSDLSDGATVKGGTIFTDIPAGSVPGSYPAVFSAEDVENVSIEGVRFIGTGAEDAASPVNSCVIKMINSSGIVKNCSFTEIKDGMVIRCRNGHDVVIDGNVIDGYSWGGIMLGDGCENCYVQNNKVVNNVNRSANYSYPITLSSYESVGEPVSKNVSCVSNYVENSFAHWEGIDLHGGENIIIASNTVIGCMSGIAINHDAASFPLNGCKVYDNIVKLGTNTADFRTVTNACIVVEGNDIDIYRNTFENGGVINDQLVTPTAAYISMAENVKITENIFENPNGNVFDVRQCDHVEIYNNTVRGLHWTTPSGGLTLPAFVNMAGRYQTNNLRVHDNLVTEYTGTINEFYGHNNNFAITGAYIKITDNTFTGGRSYAKHLKAILSPLAAGYVQYVKAGQVGDIIMNEAPATGQPIGWICTTAWVNEAGGAWTALPNL